MYMLWCSLLQPYDIDTRENGYKFHQLVGRNIQLSNNDTTAMRVTGYNQALVISSKPLTPHNPLTVRSHCLRCRRRLHTYVAVFTILHIFLSHELVVHSWWTRKFSVPGKSVEWKIECNWCGNEWGSGWVSDELVWVTEWVSEWVGNWVCLFVTFKYDWVGVCVSWCGNVG